MPAITGQAACRVGKLKICIQAGLSEKGLKSGAIFGVESLDA